MRVKEVEERVKEQEFTVFALTETAMDWALKLEDLSGRRIPKVSPRLQTVDEGNREYYKRIVSKLKPTPPKLPPFEYGRVELEKVAEDNKLLMERSYVFHTIDELFEFVKSIHQRKRLFISRWFVVKEVAPDFRELYLLSVAELIYPNTFWKKSKDLNFWLEVFDTRNLIRFTNG